MLRGGPILRDARIMVIRSPFTVPRSIRLAAALVSVALVTSPVIGCRSESSAAKKVQVKTFPVKGKIVSTDTTHVTLDHEAVPGFMEAMTMEYKLKDPSIVSELHPGDRITARIVVEQDDAGYRSPQLDNIVVVGQARPDYKPMTHYNVPKPGDAVPDFKLLNQDGKTIDLKQFQGKTLIATFIYTRCPLADFCPRMSQNFAQIDKELAADPKLYAQTHLLSISFDPEYDTPAILRGYGKAYAGAKGDFAHWDFAAPSEKDLAAVTQYFGVGVTSGESKTLNHSLSTVIIDKQGKIAAWFPSNDWKLEQAMDAIRKASAA